MKLMNAMHSSKLFKIVVVLMLALLLPAVMPAEMTNCLPPYCDNNCGEGYYDCTGSFVWTHFRFAATAWWMGFTVNACCPSH
jgi:hypothetical protein